MIQVEGLTRRFGEHLAVDDLTFTAEPGKIYGFLGPNGAGKSTTMNMMTGYLAPSKGQVLIDGCDIVRQPEEAKAKIGYLPEIPPVYGDMTVKEYLKFAAELKKVAKKDRAKAVTYAMEKTGSDQVANRLIKNLSKGYKQRVGLAQAIINNPSVIILDEPTAGLDPEQQREMLDYVRSLKEDHTIILSSHILSDINSICDFIWILNKGKLIASDTPENLRQHMETQQEVRIRVQGGDEETLRQAINKLPKILDLQIEFAADGETLDAVITTDEQEDIRPKVSEAVSRAGMFFLSMTREEKSLEDVFLTLTNQKSEAENPFATQDNDDANPAESDNEADENDAELAENTDESSEEVDK